MSHSLVLQRRQLLSYSSSFKGDLAHLELLLRCEAVNRLEAFLTNILRRLIGIAYMFFPPAQSSSQLLLFAKGSENSRFPLSLGYTGLETLDILSSKPGHSSLVLRTAHALGGNWALEVRDGGARGQSPLASLGRHCCWGGVASDQLRAEKVREVGARVYGGGQRRRVELEGDKVLRPAKG